MMGRMRDIAPLPGAREGAEAPDRADRKANARRGPILAATAAAAFTALYLLYLLGTSGVFTLPEAALITVATMTSASGTAIGTTRLVLHVPLGRLDRHLARLGERVARIEGLVVRGGPFRAADAPEPAPAGD